MKVIVTGSSGLLGSHVATALCEAGHSVRGLDTVPPRSPSAWTHITTDLRDLGTTLQLIRDVDAVAHVAGIPRPVGSAPATVFSTNMAINYSVMEAAVLNGATRFVYASSMSVLGYPFYEQPIRPSYLPLDSRHPIEAQDAYGVSKWLGEEMLDAAIRRRPGLSGVSLRMPWIQPPDGFLANVEARRARARAAPRDLWGYIDARDAAAAFVASVEKPIEGHKRLFISAIDTFMPEDTLTLVEAAYPGTRLTRAISGCDTIFDLAEAREAIGFEPRHSWRDY
ncbi:NAD-dependent epimerase/dehydratase family protein [Microvirga antarctica]|uniref:NAD-dependent epimerase/dehydratase family protein n=1 Tax=Microvirga antarctica TaxID=2819233 RepID=UPI001B317CCB|nr:NAD(P)-dependent oxidoreductase [Microvirga antarctica]